MRALSSVPARPTRRRHPARAAASVLAVAVLLSGCGGEEGSADPPAPATDGSTAAAPGTTTDPTTDPTADPTDDPAEETTGVAPATGPEARARNRVFPEWTVSARFPAGWREVKDRSLTALGVASWREPAGAPDHELSLFPPSSYDDPPTTAALARYVAEVSDAETTALEPLDVAGTPVTLVSLDYSSSGGNTGRSWIAIYLADDGVVELGSTADEEGVTEQEQREVMTSVLLTASPAP